MKKILPLLLGTLLVAGCSQPEEHTVEFGLFTPLALFSETLNGQVKELYERNYFAFEENGQMVKGDRLTIAARDSVSWTNDFRLLFDESGHLLQTDEIDENDQVFDRIILSYEGDYLVKAENYENDTLRVLGRISSDENGDITAIENYSVPEDTLRMKAILTWDEAGKSLEWCFYNPMGDTTGMYIFALDENGRRNGYKFYNRDGDQTFEQRFTYNEKGNMAKQVMINRDGEESTVEFEYEYDDMGNWTSVRCKSSQLPPIIAERTITYYGE